MKINGKNVLVAIVGETGAGKDAVVQELKRRVQIKADTGFQPIKEVCSFATRPMREGETQNVEHIFVSEAEADEVLATQNVLAYTKTGNVRYFSTVETLGDSLLYVINPDGVKYLTEKSKELGLEFFSIYITIPLETRKERASVRSDFESSFMKRVEAESEDFESFDANADWDYKIYNDDTLHVTVNQVIQILMNKFVIDLVL